MAKTATVPEMLSDLFENHDWFDEEIAIGVGYYMPNHRVPSTQSVYRWRRGDSTRGLSKLFTAPLRVRPLTARSRSPCPFGAKTRETTCT